MPDTTSYLQNLGNSYVNPPGTQGAISNTGMFQNWINSNNAYPASGRSVGATGGASPYPAATTGANLGTSPGGFGNALSYFGGIPQQALDRISNLFAGKLPSGVSSLMQQQQAQQAYGSGMPGSNMQGGTFGGNSALRNTRDIALALGQTAQNDWLSTLQAYAGNVFPTANASLDASTRTGIANLEAQLARERMGLENSQFGRELDFKYKGLASDDAYRAGQLGLGFGELGLNAERLKEDARQFERSMDYEDRKLAQTLGLSTQELALQLAQLNAQTAYQQGQLSNQQQNTALSLAQLNSTNAYNQGRLDLDRNQQGFNQLSSLLNLSGSSGMNQNNLNSILSMMGYGGSSRAQTPKKYQLPQIRLRNP